MKKKIFALVLVVALVASVAVGLAACNDKDGNIVTVGYTLYSPMNYMENGELVGFDTELAKAVFAELGYDKVIFKEINWGQKYVELNSGSVDCLWNGFTANGSDDGTPRDQLVDFSYKYMINKQCVVVKKDSAYTSFADQHGQRCLRDRQRGRGICRDQYARLCPQGRNVPDDRTHRGQHRCLSICRC